MFWVAFGAFEVLVVALFETMVSAILAQKKKMSFTGRRELKEGEMWSESTGIVSMISNTSADSASADTDATLTSPSETSQGSTSASISKAQDSAEAPLQFATETDVENAVDARDKSDLLKPIASFQVRSFYHIAS